ncbi:hypothetical protein WJX75_003934 [Coccomyxa subellipsoidea]|uniref:JmjC domain-containing protein n=1 Tax=Coccomyxa subellipsoidea TaxID=248742 RepID=A0ABR2YBT0_9CHLO
MDNPPLVLLQEKTLERLLVGQAFVEVTEGDPVIRRRLRLASHVYSSWTARGTDPAALAAHLMDGSVEALEEFVTADHNSMHDGAQQAADSIENFFSAFSSQNTDIPRRHAEQLSYDEFVLEYMAPNLPVMIEGATEGWQACRNWVTTDGGVNLEFLAERFGQARIWATASASTSDGYGGGQRHDMTAGQYVDWFRRHKQGQEEQLLYLKDWHFVNEFSDYKAYVLPEYFRDDWLNEYHDMRQTSHHSASTSNGCTSQENIVTSDYRFVYLGPKSTTTALHADVLRSFSWSVNVCGRKRWRLLPPQYTHLLYDRFGREMAPDFELDGCQAERFPNLAAARRHVIEVVQGVGEAIFVPSGWHHTVTNLEDTLSINHNWLNAFNLHWGWALLCREHAEAAAAIEECRETCSSAEEFEALVQRNMAANCGLDFRAAAAFAVAAIDETGQLAADSCLACA